MDNGLRSMLGWMSAPHRQRAEGKQSSATISADVVLGPNNFDWQHSQPGAQTRSNRGIDYPLMGPSDMKRTRSAPSQPSYRVLPSGAMPKGVSRLPSAGAEHTAESRNGQSHRQRDASEWETSPQQANSFFSPVAPLWDEAPAPKLIVPPRPSLHVQEDELSQKSTPRDQEAVRSTDASPRKQWVSTLPDTILSVSDEGEEPENAQNLENTELEDSQLLQLPGHNITLDMVYDFELLDSSAQPLNPDTTPSSTPNSSPPGSFGTTNSTSQPSKAPLNSVNPVAKALAHTQAQSLPRTQLEASDSEKLLGPRVLSVVSPRLSVVSPSVVSPRVIETAPPRTSSAPEPAEQRHWAEHDTPPAPHLQRTPSAPQHPGPKVVPVHGAKYVKLGWSGGDGAGGRARLTTSFEGFLKVLPRRLNTVNRPTTRPSLHHHNPPAPKPQTLLM